MGVSVIIPLYNKAETINRAIDSVLAQDIEHEILVVDDGSTDGSASIAEAYKGDVKCVRQENAGPSSARNLGARLSRFPYLVFLDADDELLPGCLAAHMECRRVRPDVQTTISPSRRYLKRIIDHSPDLSHQGSSYFCSRFPFQVVSGFHISWFCVDKDLFDAVKGFDPALRCWEISDFLYRVFLKTPVTGFLENAFVALHKDPLNSQFERTRKDAAYRSRYLNNMIDRYTDVPVDQQKLVLVKTMQSLKDLLVTGAVVEFRQILERLVRLNQGEISLWGLQLLSLLPDPLLRRGMTFWESWVSVRQSETPSG